MLHQDERHAAPGGQCIEKMPAGIETAGRSTDADNGKIGIVTSKGSLARRYGAPVLLRTSRIQGALGGFPHSAVVHNTGCPVDTINQRLCRWRGLRCSKLNITRRRCEKVSRRPGGKVGGSGMIHPGVTGGVCGRCFQVPGAAQDQCLNASPGGIWRDRFGIYACRSPVRSASTRVPAPGEETHRVRDCEQNRTDCGPPPCNLRSPPVSPPRDGDHHPSKRLLLASAMPLAGADFRLAHPGCALIHRTRA